MPGKDSESRQKFIWHGPAVADNLYKLTLNQNDAIMFV